jgi:hypothetical protein
MERRTAPTTRVERLVEALFDGAPEDSLATELRGWLATSNRFRAFTEAHRDKVRKKLRSANDGEARRDVRAELRIARLLLANPHMQVAYEAYGSVKGGPDFTVTYRGQPPFNLEVTRVRGAAPSVDLVRPLGAKLHQLRPAAPNAVLLAVGGTDADSLDVESRVRELRRRADARDEATLRQLGLGSTRVFYERFLRLGAVVTSCEDGAGEARAAAWVNRSARIGLSKRALAACLGCLHGAHA